MFKHFRIKRFFSFSRAAFIFVAAITSSMTTAQSNNQRLSLQQAIEKTLQQNPQLHQFKLRKEGVLSQRQTASLSPTMNLGIEIENFAGSGERNKFDTTETTVALSSVLELGAKKAARVNVVDARLSTLEHKKQIETLDLLGQLTKQFIHTLETHEAILLGEEALALTQRTRDVVHARSEKGAAPEAEVRRADAALTLAEIRLDELIQQHNRQKINLVAFWGKTDLDFSHLSGSLFQLQENVEFSDLYRRAKNSPMIAIYASETRLKNAQLQLARAYVRSNVNWQIGVRRFEENNDIGLVANLSVPLFSGKRNKGNIKSAIAQRNEVEYQHADALIKLHTRLYDAYSQHKQYARTVNQIRKKVIPALRKALSLTQTAYENGRYSYQDWVAAQHDLLNAKQMLIASAAAALRNQSIIEQLIAEPLIVNTFNGSDR